MSPLVPVYPIVYLDAIQTRFTGRCETWASKSIVKANPAAYSGEALPPNALLLDP